MQDTGMQEEKHQDAELKKILDQVNWRKYLEYGNIKVQIRAGKKTLTAIERTYPD